MCAEQPHIYGHWGARTENRLADVRDSLGIAVGPVNAYRHAFPQTVPSQILYIMSVA